MKESPSTNLALEAALEKRRAATVKVEACRRRQQYLQAECVRVFTLLAFHQVVLESVEAEILILQTRKAWSSKEDFLS